MKETQAMAPLGAPVATEIKGPPGDKDALEATRARVPPGTKAPPESM